MRAAVLLGALAGVVALGATVALGQAQAPKGKILPVLSTSDVIGYISPCG